MSGLISSCPDQSYRKVANCRCLHGLAGIRCWSSKQRPALLHARYLLTSYPPVGMMLVMLRLPAGPLLATDKLGFQYGLWHPGILETMRILQMLIGLQSRKRLIQHLYSSLQCCCPQLLQTVSIPETRSVIEHTVHHRSQVQNSITHETTW